MSVHSSGTPLEKLFCTNLVSGRVEIVASKRVRHKQCQLAIAASQRNRWAAPLNTSGHPAQPFNIWYRMVKSYHDNNNEPFERLPLLATASKKVVFYRWGAILTQLHRMSVTPHWLKVSERDQTSFAMWILPTRTDLKSHCLLVTDPVRRNHFHSATAEIGVKEKSFHSAVPQFAYAKSDSVNFPLMIHRPHISSPFRSCVHIFQILG